VVEATGSYEARLAAALYAAGLPVVVANPRWVRDFARGIGQLPKTERIDADLLAQYAQLPQLKVRQLPDEQIRELKALCARREELLDMIVAKHRLEHAPKRLRREINGHIDYLRKRLKHHDHDLDQAVRSSELLREKSTLLTSAPGVGRVLSIALLARLPELGRLNRAEVAALVGVAPVNRHWQAARRTHDRRRPRRTAPRALHGRAQRDPRQPGATRLLSAAAGPGQAGQGRAGRGHAQAPADPQCHA